MTQQEFTKRTLVEVSNSEFDMINEFYMNCECDKDEFCKEWMQFGQSKLVQGLFETAYRMNQAHQEDTQIINETREMLSDAADAMLEICNGLLSGETAEHCDSEEAAVVRGAEMLTAARELTKKAWWLVGQKEVTRRRVKNGYTLDDKDRETIIKILTK